jgi:hypothetical protein
VKLCGLQTTVKDEANESEVGTSSKKRGRPAATNKGGAKAKKTKASVNEEIDDDMKVKPEDFY